MNNPVTGATTPLGKRDIALATVGVLVGVGVGAVATRWAMLRWRRPSPPQYTEEQRRQMELLRRLAEQTGNPDYDPANRPVPEILTELQFTMGVEPADGRWSEATEQMIVGLLQQTAPAQNPVVDPEQELEPEEDWVGVYEQRFDAAVADCCEDLRIVAFDQAVTAVLERCFPDKGSFALAPGTGPWKRSARERARSDLARVLGDTELQARAALTAPVGRAALEQGADFGQAVRSMAEHAWPTVRWDGPARASWQESFCQAAAAAIQPV